MVWTQPWQALVTISMSVRIMLLITIYEKQRDGPSRALIDYLPDTREQLTVAKFVTVARKVAKRGDVAKLLKEYDFLLERMARFFHFR